MQSKTRRRADASGTHTVPQPPQQNDHDSKHQLCVTVRYVHPFHDAELEAERAVQQYHRRTLKQVATALNNAEKARRALEHDEASDMNDVFAVALEVKTLTLELNKRRAVEQLQYDRHITTLSCVVAAGRPHCLVGVPGSPVLSVYAGAAGGVEEVAMARDVRSEALLTPVPDYDEDEIEGEYHAEIKLEPKPRYVACHEGLADAKWRNSLGVRCRGSHGGAVVASARRRIWQWCGGARAKRIHRQW